MKTLTIHYADNKTATICPAVRKNLQAFSELMVELQSYWVEQEFSTADVFLRDDCWDLMTRIAALIPRLDMPGESLDIEAIGNDYKQLEQLFFCQEKQDTQVNALTEFKLESFRPSQLFELHCFNGKKKILEADDLRQARVSKTANTSPNRSKRQTSRSKAAA